jgi:hypothetical protein
MAIYVNCRAGESTTIDDAGMIQLVAVNRVPLADQRADCADICRVTGWEEQRRLRSFKFGQFSFQLGVQNRPARDQRASARAPAVFVHRKARCRDNARVAGQTQIVVRAEIDKRLAVDLNTVSALRAAPLIQRSAKRLAIEFGQSVIEPGERIGHIFIVAVTCRLVAAARSRIFVHMSNATWLEHLEDRSPPRFNQLVIWCLLATAMTLALWPFEIKIGTREGTASLLFWLPDDVVRDDWTWYSFRLALVSGSLMWLLNIALPWSCWLVALAFTTLWSLHIETTYNTAHIFHMANMLLILQAIWMTADAPLIREKFLSATYWQSPIVPRWVSLASIAYIGIFHTAAGLSKLSFSGPDWANGTSLQLWTYLWGRPWSPTTQMILGSRTLTQILQVGTLIFETAGILAIFPQPRPWIGAGLIAFYIGVLATFDYGFQFNALFTALYLLPVESLINDKRSAQFTAKP